MDWSNQPLPFKIYPTLEPLRLPSEVCQPASPPSPPSPNLSPPRPTHLPDLEAVAQLLYLSAGITRKRKLSRRRTLLSRRKPAPARFTKLSFICLRRSRQPRCRRLSLRPRRVRPAPSARWRITAASCSKPPAANSPSPTRHSPSFAPCTYWRNAWEISGSHLPPLRLGQRHAARQLARRRHRTRSASRVVCGFVDASVNRLLDVDPQREVAFSLVASATSQLSRRHLRRKFPRFVWKRSALSA